MNWSVPSIGLSTYLSACLSVSLRSTCFNRSELESSPASDSVTSFFSSSKSANLFLSALSTASTAGVSSAFTSEKREGGREGRGGAREEE